MATVPTVALNNDVDIPQLGFGVWQVPSDGTATAVRTALDAGYRSIDTAAAYRNEAGVGEAIRSSGLARQDLFVTTKLWNSDQGYDPALRAFDASLSELGLDYVDLYLIHWPLPRRDNYVDTWRALEKLHADGRVRAIGVSNFQMPHLRRLLDETEIVPAVNQVELHPNLQQAALREFHTEHGIVTEAWSPLAQGALLSDETVTSLAAKYGKSPAQIVLRWHLHLGNVVIPKSVTPSRIAENIDVFDFELADDDMTVISELDIGTRVGPDPDTFDFVG
jgi:diketogulonate reductase-like aldo/keto reductase